ncbi:MAG TPA: FG-GAP-like repeat-containing protein [Terriglobales bacterium]|nr:FG-GAP-like repeat-containing protein [Terriglobales bacterium]
MTNHPAKFPVALLSCLLIGLSLQGQEPPPHSEAQKQAELALKRGNAALAKGEYLQALAAYDEAGRDAPNDTTIAVRRAVLRSQLVQMHVDAAEHKAAQGNLAGAILELRTALQIDPGNTVVAERVREMKSMEEDLPSGKGNESEDSLKGVPEARPQSGTKSFNLRGDTHTLYDEVARAFGLTATFDPDLVSRQVRLRVDNVDFKTAMRILGDTTGTFWRPLSSTLIFVAADTAQKRREFAIQGEQTFILPSAVSDAEMTEILRVLREITGATHIELDMKSRSITVRNTPEGLRLARELIKQIDRGRGELMLQIELLEVDENAARDLGITPPSGAQAYSLSGAELQQLQQATTVENLLTILQGIFTARGITTSPTQVIPVGGGKSTYLLSLPSATANFSQALSLVQSGREVLMRAQDGQPATFFVGERYPVTLSLLSASLGGTVVGGSVTGTTFARTDFNVGQTPVAIAAQDFNNDLQPDLAVANQGDSTITILLNQGNGIFAQAPGSPITLGTSEQGPSGIASGTFRLTDATHITQPADLVIANATSNTVSVLLGNGDGTFTEAPGSPFAVGAQPRAVVVTDFNGDGMLDFAVANTGDNTISVFKGNGDGTFTQFANSPFHLAAGEQGPVAMVEGNFRDSSTPGLAVVNVTTNNVAILEAVGGSTFNGTFTEETGSPIGVGQLPVAIASGDLNADGFPDLAVVNQTDNTVTVLLNNGDGTFTPAAGSPLPTSSTPSGVAIADFNADGLGDIAVTNNGVSTLGVYIGLGSGLFSTRLELSTSTGPGAVVSKDLNGDGLPDVALTAHSASSNQVTVFLDPTSFAQSSVGQVPFPGSEYIDLGVKLKATPTINSDDEVTLQLEFEIRSLAGTSVNGIPVITNRTLKQTVRLREDETSIVTGLLDKEETNAIAGLPGFAELPLGAGYAFGTQSNSSQDNEFLILITPRRLRLPERSSKILFAGRGGATTGGTGPVAPAAGEGFIPEQRQNERAQPQSGQPGETQPEPQRPTEAQPRPQPQEPNQQSQPPPG